MSDGDLTDGKRHTETFGGTDSEQAFATAEYAVALIRAALKDEKPSAPPTGTDMGRLLDFVRRHYVAVPAFVSLREGGFLPDGELRKEWERAYHVCVHKEISQSLAYEETVAACAAAGIDLLPLKGLRLKELYPRREFRLMSDLDIFYDEKRFAQLKKTMKALGYRFVKSTKHSNHQIFSKEPDVDIEMHRDLLSSRSPYYDYCRQLVSRAQRQEDGSNLLRLSAEDEYIFMILHAQKHADGAGTGIRTAADVWLFLKKYAEVIDFGYVREQLRKAEQSAVAAGKGNLGGDGEIFSDSSGAGGSLCEFETFLRETSIAWFEKGEFCKEPREIELLGGVYGVSERRWEKGCEREGGAKKYFWRRVFPPLRQMKEGCPILKKAPFLLPFCYVARLSRILFTRRRDAWSEYRFIHKKEKEQKRAKKTK